MTVLTYSPAPDVFPSEAWDMVREGFGADVEAMVRANLTPAGPVATAGLLSSLKYLEPPVAVKSPVDAPRHTERGTHS